MSKYRFKTEEEFKKDDQWVYDRPSHPVGWNDDGIMNAYMGQEIPDEYNSKIELHKSFKMENWIFEPEDCVLNEEKEVDITEVIDQLKQLNQNSLKTEKKMEKTKTNKKTAKNPVAEKFVFMDKTVNILNVGFQTGKNVVLFGPGE